MLGAIVDSALLMTYEWGYKYGPNMAVANTIGNVEAVQIAIAHYARIQYDETAQSPYFRYWQEDVEHEVWFEDVRSLAAKFALVKRYGLQGMGYWQIMRWWRANWLALEDEFLVQKGF